MLKYTLKMAGATDTGRVRAYNEDAIAWNEQAGIALLADGMGGHRGGGIASQMTLDSLMQSLEPALAAISDEGVASAESLTAILADTIRLANGLVYQTASHDPACKGMGTTLVATVFHGPHLIVAHAGDSRLYRWRHGRLMALTRDHSLVQELVDSGLLEREQIGTSQYRHVITRAVGIDDELVIDTAASAMEPGDVYLLSSDGLHGVVDEAGMAAVLQAAAPDWDLAARQLIEEANRCGGPDNVSAILAVLEPAR